MKTQPKQTIREKIKGAIIQSYTSDGIVDYIDPELAEENFIKLLNDLFATLPTEEMKDEREIVSGVCQGCQEVENCCDCPSEKNRQYYNTHVAELRRWKQEVMKELGGDKNG